MYSTQHGCLNARDYQIKARFCCQGDKKVHGVDYFDTYSPVVYWTKVRIILILSLILGLDTKQIDYTCDFLHTLITEDVYVCMSRGFKEEGKVLKLQRSLYGLRQSPRNFFECLKENLIKVGFKQSEVDPCLFISEKVICLVYVGDTLFFSSNESDIDRVLKKLRELKWS